MSNSVMVDPPRTGFYIIVVSYLAAGAFLWFGAQQPRLDEAFEILAQRDQGNFGGFTEQNIKVLARLLSDNTGFSRALLGRSTAKFLEPRVDGWLKSPDAHLVVRPDAGKATALRLEATGRPTDFPATITITGEGFEKKLELNSSEPLNFELTTTEVAKPRILKFEVAVASRGKPSSSWGLRVAAGKSTNRESQ